MNTVKEFIVDVRHGVAIMLSGLTVAAIFAVFIAWVVPKDASAVGVGAFIVLIVALSVVDLSYSVAQVAKALEGWRDAPAVPGASPPVDVDPSPVDADPTVLADMACDLERVGTAPVVARALARTLYARGIRFKQRTP